jgi:hypothetical protein
VNVPLITHMRFTPASPAQRKAGLVGWTRCRADGRWELDGIAVRVTERGEPCVTLPARNDGLGKKHRYFWPVDEEANESIARQILDALRAEGMRL